MRKQASKSSNSETLRHRVLPVVAEASSAHDHAVILFDGTCAFCEGAVKFIARRDPAGYFKYGASQSPTAAALLAPYAIGHETARSIVLIEAGQVYLRSTASLRIASRLPFPWSLAGALLVVQRPLRDVVYHVSSRPYASGWPVHQMRARCPRPRSAGGSCSPPRMRSCRSWSSSSSARRSPAAV